MVTVMKRGLPRTAQSSWGHGHAVGTLGALEATAHGLSPQVVGVVPAARDQGELRPVAIEHTGGDETVEDLAGIRLTLVAPAAITTEVVETVEPVPAGDRVAHGDERVAVGREAGHEAHGHGGDGTIVVASRVLGLPRACVRWRPLEGAPVENDRAPGGGSIHHTRKMSPSLS